MGKRDDNEIDDFLNHTGRDRGAFLGDWKKKKNPITVWLAMKPIAIWQHGFQRVVVREDRNTGRQTTHVWGDQINCREGEAVLKKQYKRDDDNIRVLPPVHCGFCRFVEAIYQLIVEGKIKLSTPLFSFEGDDGEVVVHAGGLCGLFKADDLSDAELKEIKEAGIRLKDSWKENGLAKLKYAFAVVDNDNPAAGIQISIEPGIVGQKVQEVILKAVKSLKSKDRGNPLKNPYAIEWEYNEQEQQFDKKYAATRMEEIELTRPIERLIRGDKPDMRRIVQPANQQTLRAKLEEFCLLKKGLIDWDDVFDLLPIEEDEDEATEFDPKKLEEQRPALTEGRRAPARAKKAKEEEPEEQDELDADGNVLVACAECDKPMREKDDVCPHCGHNYAKKKAPAALPPKTTKQRRGDDIPFGR